MAIFENRKYHSCCWGSNEWRVRMEGYKATRRSVESHIFNGICTNYMFHTFITLRFPIDLMNFCKIEDLF